MATHNTSVQRVYATNHAQNAWAYLAGEGWKKVQTGNGDGVTNVHLALTGARTSGIVPTVVTDTGDANITTIYL
jgi:immune inhibitor A